MPKWVKKWDVPSSSDPDKTYVVSLAEDGETWGCSCPQWKFRRKHLPDGRCGHILDVQAGLYTPRGDGEAREPPVITLAQVQEVTVDGGQALTPLIPIGDTHFEATVVYDLWRVGVPWGELKGRYSVAKRNSRAAIIAYVKGRGRRVYGPLTHLPGMQTYQTMPVKD